MRRALPRRAAAARAAAAACWRRRRRRRAPAAGTSARRRRRRHRRRRPRGIRRGAGRRRDVLGVRLPRARVELGALADRHREIVGEVLAAVRHRLGGGGRRRQRHDPLERRVVDTLVEEGLARAAELAEVLVDLPRRLRPLHRVGAHRLLRVALGAQEAVGGGDREVRQVVEVVAARQDAQVEEAAGVPVGPLGEERRRLPRGGARAAAAAAVAEGGEGVAAVELADVGAPVELEQDLGQPKAARSPSSVTTKSTAFVRARCASCESASYGATMNSIPSRRSTSISWTARSGVTLCAL